MVLNTSILAVFNSEDDAAGRLQTIVTRAPVNLESSCCRVVRVAHRKLMLQNGVKSRMQCAKLCKHHIPDLPDKQQEDLHEWTAPPIQFCKQPLHM